MNTFIIVLGLAIVAIAVFLVFRRKRTASSEGESTVDNAASSAGSGGGELTPEMKRLYGIGMKPSADGVTVMYALETCRHCRRTKEFLDENHLSYHNIYVDQYSGKQRAELMDKVRSVNPRGSFPTVILPNGKVVVGYREQLLREALIDDAQRTS